MGIAWLNFKESSMNDVEIPLTVFIVDDEPPARNRLKDLLTY